MNMSARRTKPTDTVYDKVLPNKPKAEVGFIVSSVINENRHIHAVIA